MADLRERFGRLLAAHRRRSGLTQEALAERAGLSVDMISKIESGTSGARFPSIERLAAAVQVDPAELFTSDIPHGRLRQGAFVEVSAKLASLSESDLEWIGHVIDAALARGHHTRSPNRVSVVTKREKKRAAPKRKPR